MRDAASRGLLRGERRVHGFRVCECSVGRSEGHGHWNRLDGKCSGAASAGASTCARSTSWVFAGLGLQHVSRTVCNATSFGREWRRASAASDGGYGRRTATAGTAVATSATGAKFPGALLPCAAGKNTSDFCAAGDFSRCSGSTQLLCGVHEKSGNSALRDAALVLLWSGDQLALGHH